MLLKFFGKCGSLYQAGVVRSGAPIKTLDYVSIARAVKLEVSRPALRASQAEASGIRI
jgi:hypothetical protein